MYPLQSIQPGDFWSKGTEGTHAEFFFVGVGIIVMVLIILNLVKSKIKTTDVVGSKSAINSRPRQYSSFTLHRITAELGLNREQTKMLDYVLKSGGVTDPARLLNSPSLLDRHFKRTYRLIERNSASEEELNERLSVLFSTRNIIESNAGGANERTAASTREVPSNATAVLTVGKVNYPVRVVSSRGESLMVEHPATNSGNLIHFTKGSPASLAVFTKSSKGFSVETRILGSGNTAEGPVLQLAHSNKIRKLSSRRFRRRQTLIATGFYFVYPPEDKNQKMTIDKRRFSGNIMDISIGGCSIKTSTPVNSGQKIKVEFTRDDNSTIAALGEVLRTNRTGINTIMHVKFLKVPRRSLNSINAMVYEYTDE